MKGRKCSGAKQTEQNNKNDSENNAEEQMKWLAMIDITKEYTEK